MSKKDDILNHAKRLFAEKGYEGTVMEEVASLSDVNKATIYYYFKDKENLYNKVFKDSIEKVHINIENQLENMNNPKKALKVYIDVFYATAEEDETFIRILMREVASNGKHFPQEVVEEFLSVVSILDNILLSGYQIGVFRKHDTKVVHFMIIGTISYFIASKPIRKIAPDKFRSVNIDGFFDSENDVAEILYKIILNGLEKK